MNQRPNCHACAHYYVTWEKNHPYGCRAYGFKSPQIPAMVVYRSSSQECSLFQPKPKPKV